MARFAGVVASCAILGLGTGGYARTHNREEPLDPAKGAKLSSRLPCDGATNPQDQINLTPTFSLGTLERSFRIDVFEDKYCKRMDLGFACLTPRHSLWKQEWSVDSSHPEGRSYGLDSCSEWGSKDTPRYVLTGWYREGGPESKLPWKQAVVKQVPSRWEVFEFADPSGGTGRLEINRW
jgi:hypothetical protein